MELSGRARIHEKPKLHYYLYSRVPFEQLTYWTYAPKAPRPNSFTRPFPK